MTEKNRNVLLAIGGGIAAYKAVHVASRLHQAGHATYVAMTRAAQQFVTPLTFAGVTGRRVVSDMFVPPASDDRESVYPHLYPATEADLFAVLPATANLIGKLAHGIGDDVVTTAALSLPAHCLRFYCPAMNVEMWNQPVVQENARQLDERGWQRIGPAAGRLACGTEGYGRMSEPDEILRRLLDALQGDRPLTGKRLLILSGPTVEQIDPVRFISNHSSGRMGKALAEAAFQAGAMVEFVTGPVSEANLPRGGGITLHQVQGARDMLAAAQHHFSEVDGAIFAAAVADYTVENPLDQKLPKQAESFDLRLCPTPDIAATLAASRQPGQRCIGFALETDDGLHKAHDKCRRKHLDAIILNGADSLGAADGNFTLIHADGSEEPWGRLDKATCARRLIAALAELLAAR